MTPIEINRYLNTLVEDLPARTVDRVIYGDADRPVRGIAVAWMPYADTIREAACLGANLLVVHEPTFYDHWDLEGKAAHLPEVEAKKRLIDEHGITIIRCHDVWDAMPGIGIPCAWGDFLGLGEPVHSVRHYNVYEVAPVPAAAFAATVAARVAPLGQPVVGFYGDGERRVRRIGLGTGCISDPFTIYGLGADLAIAVDDIVRAWVAGEWCRDGGRPLVVVNHCVSEEPGMASLARYLAATYPGLPVHHIAQGCTYAAIAPR